MIIVVAKGDLLKCLEDEVVVMSEYSIHPEKGTLHGVLDSSLKPALHIKSGDILHVETLEADWRISKPDPVTLQAPFFPERDLKRDVGHALCGPVYVEGVLPGDSLRIDILALEPGDWGWSSVGISNSDHLDRLGFRGEEYFRVWTVRDGICEDADGFRTPADPFPGVLAVAPKGDDPVRTHIPGPHGGNLDCKELRAGVTVYLPVSHPGALFSVGDGHAAQGDGESGGASKVGDGDAHPFGGSGTVRPDRAGCRHPSGPDPFGSRHRIRQNL